MTQGEPIPFAGWIGDAEDTETMLREQINAQQHEINRLRKELMDRDNESNLKSERNC